MSVRSRDRLDLPPRIIGPEQPVAVEGRDRELAGIALEAAKPLGQDAEIAGTGAQRSGLLAAHLSNPPGPAIASPNRLGCDVPLPGAMLPRASAGSLATSTRLAEATFPGCR